MFKFAPEAFAGVVALLSGIQDPPETRVCEPARDQIVELVGGGMCVMPNAPELMCVGTSDVSDSAPILDQRFHPDLVQGVCMDFRSTLLELIQDPCNRTSCIRPGSDQDQPIFK